MKLAAVRHISVFAILMSLAAVFSDSAQAEQPAERLAVILHAAAVAPDGPKEFSRLSHALERNGYQGVPNHGPSTLLTPATERGVRALVNTLQSSPGGAELILFYQGPFYLKSDGSAWLGPDDRPEIAWAALARQLDRLEPEKFSIAMLLDVDSKDSLGEIEKAVTGVLQSVKANLHVLIARREPSVPLAPSPVIPLLCGALTYGREVNGNGDGVLCQSELRTLLEDRLLGTAGIACVSSPNASQPLRFARLVPPSSLDDVIEDVSDELVCAVQDYGVSVVAIADFEERNQAKTVANPPSRYSGPLAPYITEQVRRHVRQALEKKVQVVDSQPELSSVKETIAVAMGTAGVDPKENAEQRAQLTLGGTIVVYQGGKQTQTVALHEATTPLNVDEAGMSGHVNMSPKAALAATGINWTINDIDAPPARAPHPMSAQDFPLQVYIESAKGKPLTHSFSKDGRRMYYESLGKGDEYAIAIENKTKHDLFLRLLVDGRNTLPDRSDDRDMFEPAQYVSLTRARCWFCEAGKKYRVAGFYTHVGAAEGRWKAFCVTDVNDALPQGEHREQLGIITAAFYEAVPKDKSSMASQPRFATRMGAEGEGEVGAYEGDRGPGGLIGNAPINIHYGFGSDGDH